MDNDLKVSRRTLLNSALALAATQITPAIAFGERENHQYDVRQSGVAGSGRRQGPPNIVFIIMDDQRFDDLSSTGHPYAKTPHIDRIAHEGVQFVNARCTTPLCSPSRASHLTGLYVHTHRIQNNDKDGLGDISHFLPTVPRLLHTAGYETAFIGKWHMGFDDTVRPGFDNWISFRALGLYENNVFNVNGNREQSRGYMTDYLNERAVEFIRKPKNGPFAMYLAYLAVHSPYLPAARYNNLYTNDSFRAPTIAPGDLEGKPVLRRPIPPVDFLEITDATPQPQESRNQRPGGLDAVTRDRARCLASVNDGVGMILDALEQTGELDNTIIVYTSDHGYLMGEHGIDEEKRWAYEPSLRIPLFMRYPKAIPAGSVRAQNALNIDIAPTLLELAGVQSHGTMHGKSLVPVLANAEAPLRDSYLCEYFFEKAIPNVPKWQCARKGQWKYIHYPELVDMDELYDLSSDPREESNLANRSSSSPTLTEMKKEMDRLLAATGGDLAIV